MDLVRWLVLEGSGLDADVAGLAAEYYGMPVPSQVVQWPFHTHNSHYYEPSAWIVPEGITGYIYGLTARLGDTLGAQIHIAGGQIHIAGGLKEADMSLYLPKGHANSAHDPKSYLHVKGGDVLYLKSRDDWNPGDVVAFCIVYVDGAL